MGIEVGLKRIPVFGGDFIKLNPHSDSVSCHSDSVSCLHDKALCLYHHVRLRKLKGEFHAGVLGRSGSLLQSRTPVHVSEEGHGEGKVLETDVLPLFSRLTRATYSEIAQPYRLLGAHKP